MCDLPHISRERFHARDYFLGTASPIRGFTDTVNTRSQVVIKDSSIKSSIKAQFGSDSSNGFGLSHFDVDVDHQGVVSLEGKVPSQEAVARAVSITRATKGVRKVKGQLKVTTDD